MYWRLFLEYIPLQTYWGNVLQSLLLLRGESSSCIVHFRTEKITTIVTVSSLAKSNKKRTLLDLRVARVSHFSFSAPQKERKKKDPMCIFVHFPSNSGEITEEGEEKKEPFVVIVQSKVRECIAEHRTNNGEGQIARTHTLIIWSTVSHCISIPNKMQNHFFWTIIIWNVKMPPNAI